MLWKTLCFLFVVNCVSADLYGSNSDVVDLTPDNFDKKVLSSDAVWVVEFYAPWCGHCRNLVPEYNKAARALKGVAKVGAVNADEHKALGQKYGVRGFPTIKVFGLDKSKPDDFNGQRTADGISEVVLNTIRRKVNVNLGKGGSGDSSSSGGSSGSKKDVVELTESNFDDLVFNSKDLWLVEFFAPWCGHCKNLAPEWAKAASELKGKVKLGALDATAHQSKAAEYDIKGYPTIKFFRPGTRHSSDAEEYNGGRTSADIVAWALEKLSESQPPPEVVELTSENILKENCEGKQLCVVSVLPYILDCQSNCRDNYIRMLKKLAENFKRNTWGWLWAEATAQPELETALGLGGFGYPALVAVNFKRMSYSPLRGAFSDDGISEFLKAVSYGRGAISTFPIVGEKWPEIKIISPWDGKDGELLPEEDIDLSDVDLKDEL